MQPIFHASDVTELRVIRRGGSLRVELATGFLGVVEGVSPLANYFTEDVLRAESLDETALRSFYDLFHHRLIAFVYGAHLRAAPSWEVRADGTDRISRRSLELSGAPRPPEGKLGLSTLHWGGLAGSSAADRGVGARSRRRSPSLSRTCPFKSSISSVAT